MHFHSPDLIDGQPIPAEFAFGTFDPVKHVAFSTNRNPALRWSELPSRTRSLVLTCHDPDVPSITQDVNREDRLLPASLPRKDFFHWVLVDLPTEPGAIDTGEFSDGVTPGGKLGPAHLRGSRQGINNYREWFGNDQDMGGKYYGYDGPCPPWNDSVVHHYVFTLYALNIQTCPVQGDFTGPEVLAAIEGHVLDSASITGTYSLNPALRA